MTDTITPTLDEAALKNFGQRLFKLFEVHETDRKDAEQRWLKSLRQFRGIYDPEVLRLIGSDQSKAYPKVTRWKVIGTVARLMQMLFPQTEKNFGVHNSPMPSLSLEQLQEVLDKLVAAKTEGQAVDPAGVELGDEEIEKAIREYAAHKAARMELKCEDDFAEMEYITLARRVVFSAVLYNVGVLKGPMHKSYTANTWRRNINTGKYEAVEVQKLKPLFEFLPVWNWYPDMTAKTLDQQDGTFERNVMTRRQVEELADRKDFMGDRVNEWLREHREGNYRARYWETDMKAEPKSDRTTATADGRKYEVLSYWGGVTGHELRAAGATIADNSLGKTFQASVWSIENTVIKAKLSPYLGTIRNYHEFVFEEDDLSLLGNGQCDTLRDSQFAICEVARSALDNASVIGTQLELNMDLLMPGTDTNLRKNKTWLKEASGVEAQTRAVQNIPIDSHLTELIALFNIFMEIADKESGLPPPSLGDVSGGGSEALRTQKNASMFLGAAALPIRDTVRNFDTFTISVVSALIAWNKKYDPNPSRDGDHDVIGRGSTSLIAKEVLAESLDAFRTTLTPDELPHVKVRKLLEYRAKARDIPIDELLEDEDKANQTIAMQAQSQQQQLQKQEELVAAQVQQTLADALKKVAEAHKADASVEIDAVEQLIKALSNETNKGNAAKAGA